MKPSRDLDERIAEEVTGWTNIHWHFDRVEPMSTWLGGTPPGIDLVTGHIEEIPEYSTDIDGTKHLIDYISKTYDYIDIFSDCGHWFCSIKHFDSRGWIFLGSGDDVSFMMAVCKAALRINKDDKDRA